MSFQTDLWKQAVTEVCGGDFTGIVRKCHVDYPRVLEKYRELSSKRRFPDKEYVPFDRDYWNECVLKVCGSVTTVTKESRFYDDVLALFRKKGEHKETQTDHGSPVSTQRHVK